MTDRKKRSSEAERILQQVIVYEGKSYAGAVSWCEAQAKLAAQPYLEVAAELRAELEKSA